LNFENLIREVSFVSEAINGKRFLNNAADVLDFQNKSFVPQGIGLFICLTPRQMLFSCCNFCLGDHLQYDSDPYTRIGGRISELLP
jgi:hypothetical protein